MGNNIDNNIDNNMSNNMSREEFAKNPPYYNDYYNTLVYMKLVDESEKQNLFDTSETEKILNKLDKEADRLIWILDQNLENARIKIENDYERDVKILKEKKMDMIVKDYNAARKKLLENEKIELNKNWKLHKHKRYINMIKNIKSFNFIFDGKTVDYAKIVYSKHFSSQYKGGGPPRLANNWIVICDFIRKGFIPDYKTYDRFIDEFWKLIPIIYNSRKKRKEKYWNTFDNIKAKYDNKLKELKDERENMTPRNYENTLREINSELKKILKAQYDEEQKFNNKIYDFEYVLTYKLA